MAAGGLSSALLLCLTHGHAFWLAPLAPLPLLWVAAVASRRQGFYAGLLCGLGEAAILAGVCHAGAVLWLLLAGFYGLSRALFVCLWQATPARQGGWGAALGASLWVVLERLQAAVPLSLPTLLGDTQHRGPWLPLARLVGTYGVAWGLVWCAGVLRLWLQAPRAYPWRATLVLVLGLLAARLLAAADAWPAAAPADVPTARVRLVQGGLPTWLYARAETEPAWAHVPEATYTALTRSGPAVDLSIWPETAIWGWWGADAPLMARLRGLAAARGPLLLGLPRRDAGGAAFNSAVWLDPEDRAGPQLLDKQRLALRAEAQFTPGLAAAPLAWRGGSLGVVFCLESVVPERTRALARAGAGALVVLAEGSRFGGTVVGRLHAQRSVLRAVETGRTVLHLGQHGDTQVAGPRGRERAPLPAFTAATYTTQVPLRAAPSLYVRCGDWGLGALLLLPGLGLLRRRQRQASSSSRLSVRPLVA